MAQPEQSLAYIGDAFLARVSSHADFAFQPVIDPYTGALYGVEALFRGHSKLGYDCIKMVFDDAYDLGILHSLEITVRHAALQHFKALNLPPSTRLFLNIDHRILHSADYRPGDTVNLVAKVGLKPSNVCLELSACHQVAHRDRTAQNLTQAYRAQSFRISVDDFGSGYAGLKLLYEEQPDYIKIDRFFIADLATDRTKRLVLAQIINLAQTLGILVVAEGVETKKEFLICKELGVNLMQGFYIQRPVRDASELQANYTSVVGIEDRRRTDKDRHVITQEMELHPALSIDTTLLDVFDWFRRHKNRTFFPVVNEAMEPLGIVREEDLKDFTYSRYGKELLSNTSFRKSLIDFLTPTPVADIRDEAEQILEKFTLNQNREGIILVENTRYVGLLTASSMLRIINEKHLAMARDQNPLSKLPGNNRVTAYVNKALSQTHCQTILVYIDFDNFKPFNDTYGFRQGDRAILLFAELMQKVFVSGEPFLGHVGGDDFFVGIQGADVEHVHGLLKKLRTEFRHQAETFYDKDARDAGGILAKDRFGRIQKFELLSISCAGVCLEAGRPRCEIDELVNFISGLKNEAKSHPEGIALASSI